MQSIDFDLRNSQAGALTGQEDDEHPFTFAEQGPNRYQSVTWFFPEEDGVRVEQDLDLDPDGDSLRVFYFDTEGKEEELQSGALFDWAVRAYHNC